MESERHVHLDAVGGVAGDMFVAAMLAAMPEFEHRVMQDVGKVLPPGYAARLEPGLSEGLAVLRLKLDGKATERGGHHHHHHDHPVHYPEIVARIEGAVLSAGTAAHAVAILRRIAEAESAMHGVPLEHVHFHEIADWDSLMDVVAAGSIAAALDGSLWTVSELPLGGGLVQTQHGKLPVPAPATAAILQGFRWRDDGVAGERVTPTGAAILAHLVMPTTHTAPSGTLLGVGMGAGTRRLQGMPNVLRALVFEGDAQQEETDVVVVAFDVDDMSGEEIGVAADRLRAEAAVLDLTLGTRSGKKGRPVTDFRLLVRPDRAEAVLAQCLLETSTIGLRWRREHRRCLPRAADRVVADGVEVRRKLVERPDGRTSRKAESDDLAALPGLTRRRHLKQIAEQL
jgi:uncharacterized protein (TIGR00299 family) protein